MSGNRQGGLKIKAALIARLGEEGYKEYVRERGSRGGSAPKTKPSGFAAMSREQVSAIGARGGKASRRGKAR